MSHNEGKKHAFLWDQERDPFFSGDPGPIYKAFFSVSSSSMAHFWRRILVFGLGVPGAK
jgi:hypothetical protein